MFVVESAAMDYERSGEEDMRESVEHYRDEVTILSMSGNWRLIYEMGHRHSHCAIYHH